MKPAVNEEKTGRRSFLGYMIAAMGAFIASVLGASTAIFAASPILGQRRGTWVDLGPVSSFQVGVPKMVDFSLERKDGWIVEDTRKSVWVVQASEKQFITYSPRCTHLGCIVNWIPEQKVFRSPCHNGIFSLDGTVMGGPPPRPLDRLEHRVEGDRLKIEYVEFRLGVPEKEEV